MFIDSFWQHCNKETGKNDVVVSFFLFVKSLAYVAALTNVPQYIENQRQRGQICSEVSKVRQVHLLQKFARRISSQLQILIVEITLKMCIIWIIQKKTLNIMFQNNTDVLFVRPKKVFCTSHDFTLEKAPFGTHSLLWVTYMSLLVRRSFKCYCAYTNDNDNSVFRISVRSKRLKITDYIISIRGHCCSSGYGTRILKW